MKDKPHCDVFGTQLAVGDYVIYGAALGRSSIVKVAKILELRTKQTPYRHPEVRHKVSVRTAHRQGDWRRDDNGHYHWEVQKSGKPVTLEFTERMVRVEPESIPQHVRDLVDGKPVD